MKVVIFICAFWQLCLSANIPEVAQSLGTFTTILDLEDKAGLKDGLSGPGPFTVFFPNDAAFARIKKQDLDKVKQDTELLKEVLQYHTVSGSYKTSDLVNDQTLQSLEGHMLRFNRYNGEAIATVNGRIISQSIEADNGVIHVVDDPIEIWPELTIAEKISSEPELSNLSYALNLTNLIGTLHEAGPYTVLAPTNKAFKKVADLESLLADVPQLTKVLRRHIIPGTIFFVGLPYDNLVSVDSEDLTARYKNETLIVKVDDVAVNGVIHGVDALLV